MSKVYGFVDSDNGRVVQRVGNHDVRAWFRTERLVTGPNSGVEELQVEVRTDGSYVIEVRDAGTGGTVRRVGHGTIAAGRHRTRMRLRG